MATHPLCRLPRFETEDSLSALGALHLCVSGRKFMILVGPPGAGKTTLALSYRNPAFDIHYILCSPNMRMKDVLRSLASAIELHFVGSSYELQNALVNELKLHPHHCFILDECEYLNKNDLSKLEVIRQIWDQTNVPFILLGTDKLQDEIKGVSQKGTVNHPQIYRRLCRARLSVMKQNEVLAYLTLLEKEYAVRFTREARTDLYNLCTDRNNGGMGNFIEVLELVFTLTRPEWQAIGYQLSMAAMCKQSSESVNVSEESLCFEFDGKTTDDLFPESEIRFDPIDVDSLAPVSITRDVVVSAMEYKLTK